MANYSSSEAINILNNLSNYPQYQGVAGLTQLLADTSISVPGASANATSLFYAGMVGTTHSSTFATAISAASGGSIITVDQTPQGELLSSLTYQDAFKLAAKTAGYSQADANVLINGGVLSNGTPVLGGLWNNVSIDFAGDATNAMSISSTAGTGSVWYNSEIPTLIAKGTPINGLPASDFQGLSNADIAAKVNAESYGLMNQLQVAYDTSGKILGINTGSIFSNSTVNSLSNAPTGSSTTTISDLLSGKTTIPTATSNTVPDPFVSPTDEGFLTGQNLTTLQRGASLLGADSSTLISVAGKGLSAFGVAAIGASYYQAVQTAQQQAASGNSLAAQTTMLDWTASMEGGIAGGALAGEYATPLLAGGPPGWAAYTAIVLGGGLVGSASPGAMRSLLNALTDSPGSATTTSATHSDGSVWNTTTYANGTQVAQLASSPANLILAYNNVATVPDSNGDGGYTQISTSMSSTSINTRTNVYALVNGQPILQSTTTSSADALGNTQQTITDGSGKLVETIADTPQNSGGDIQNQLNLSSNGQVANSQSTDTQANGQVSATISGTGDVAYLNNAIVSLAAGAQATINGNGNVASAAGSDSIWFTGINNSLSGSSCTVNGGGGATLTLAGSSNNDVVTLGSNGAVNIADGDHGEVVNASNDKVTLGKGVNVTVNGPSDTVNTSANDVITAAGDTVRVGGNGGGNTGNTTVAGSNDFVDDLGSNNTLSVIGTNQTVQNDAQGSIYLGSNTSVTDKGTGDIFNTAAGDAITAAGDTVRVGGNGGGNTAVTTVSGSNDFVDDLGSNNTLAVVGTNQTVQNDAQGYIYLGSNTSVTDKGTGDTFNTAAGDVITAAGDTVRVGGNGGGNTAVTTVTGSNDFVDDLGSNNTLAVVGTNQTVQNDAQGYIYLGSNTSVTDKGTGDTFNTAAGDVITAVGDTVRVGGNGGGNTAVTTVFGSNDFVDDLGSNNTLAVVGTNQTVQNDAQGSIYLGSNTSVTDKGTGDTFNTAAGDVITAAGDTVRVGGNGGGNTAVTTVFGNNDFVDDLGSNNTLAVVGTNQTVQNDAQGSIYLGSNTSVTDKGTGDTMNTAAGDTIMASGDTIRVGNNLAAGQSAGNTIIEGNDTIYGGTGNTLLVQGNDTIYGNSDTVYEFNSAAQETDQLYLDTAGKESFDAKFTAGAAYSYEEDKFNDSGNQIEADKFNAGNGQLSETDVWNGTSPYVAWREIANGGSYYSEIDSFNAAGNEIQAEKFNQSSGQLSEIISWDGTHPYATQEEFSNGGSYFSEIDNFNPTTGAETSGGEFNSQTGSEVDYYNNGSWYAGNQNYSDSSDSGYTDNGDSGYVDSGSECEGNDPVILNLQGGKVQTTSLSGSNAYFDMTNDGQKVQTGWATAGEGMLVYDPNNTGTVTNDSNLVAGFAQLSMLAKQTGGVLDASNPLWNELKVWVDPTGTANFQQGQLETLSQLGITSINLNSPAEKVNNNGNTILNDSTFTWKNGVTGDIAGVNLAFNPIAATTSPTTSGSSSGGSSSGSLNHLIQSMAAFTDGNTGIDQTFSSRNAIADTFHLAASHVVQHA